MVANADSQYYESICLEISAKWKQVYTYAYYQILLFTYYKKILLCLRTHLSNKPVHESANLFILNKNSVISTTNTSTTNTSTTIDHYAVNSKWINNWCRVSTATNS